jgi:long-subunit fatty acid transport protein
LTARRHRTLVVAAACFLAAGGGSAQEPPSSTQLGVSIGSGARALGMGGAFIAVADDATAASWNPAGLAVLQRAEASLVFKVRERQTLDRAPGTTTLQQRGLASTESFGGQVDALRGQSLDFVSLTYPVRIGSVRLVPQVNYQRAIDLGYDRRSVTHATTTTHLRQASAAGASFEDTTASSSVDDAETGGIDVWAASIALTPHPKLQVGVSLNGWRNGSTLDESSLSDSVICLTASSGARDCASDQSRFAGTAQQSFAGWNVNLGLLLRATPKLRFGLVFKAPFDMQLTRQRSFQNDLSHRGPEGQSQRLTRFSRYETGTIRWPSTLGLGVALAPHDDLLVSIDFTTTRWSRAEYDYTYRSETIDANPAPGSFNSVDAYTENARLLWPTRLDAPGFPVDPTNPYRARRQRDTFQLRAGVERVLGWRSLVLPVRAGGFVDSQYFTNSDGSRVASAGVSVGVGVSWKNVSFDAAYVRQELRSSRDFNDPAARAADVYELRSLRDDRIGGDRLYLSTIVRF